MKRCRTYEMYDTGARTAPDEVTTTLKGIPAAEIRSELEQILRSRTFIQSHRIRRFLQFVVEECLLGQHHRLKEYLIGLEVFNRREAFDPRVDSIVRVEARRLRAKIEEYYLTEGREDELRILLRKGSYVPVFEYRRDGSNGLGGFTPSHRRSISISSFLVSNGGGNHMALVDDIKRRLAHVLIKEGYFRVLSPSQLPSATAEPGADPPRADYLLEGIVEIHELRIRLILQLQNGMDGSYSW